MQLFSIHYRGSHVHWNVQRLSKFTMRYTTLLHPSLIPCLLGHEVEGNQPPEVMVPVPALLHAASTLVKLSVFNTPASPPEQTVAQIKEKTRVEILIHCLTEAKVTGHPGILCNTLTVNCWKLNPWSWNHGWSLFHWYTASYMSNIDCCKSKHIYVMV